MMGYASAGATLVGRGDNGWIRDITDHITNSTSAGFAAHVDAAIDEVRLQAARSIRTSIITLASFNTIAAAATLACIVGDCYRVAKRKNANFKFTSLRPSFVALSETYPLILSIGIVTQGIIFAVAQSKGLRELRIENCMALAQIMMPATFIVPFIQLIFGVETAVRACWPTPFPTRPSWTVPLCLTVVIAGLIVLYVVTFSLRPPDSCFASLIWYTQAWRLVCFGLFTAIASTLLVSGGIILFRLRSVSHIIPPMDRVAASQMVCFAAIGVISNVLLIPFYYKISFVMTGSTGNYEMDLSTIASIAANLSGVFTGGLYLFLRTSRNRLLGSDARDGYEQQSEKGNNNSWQPNMATYQRHIPKKSTLSTYSESMYPTDGMRSEKNVRIGSTLSNWRLGKREPTSTWASSASSRIPSIFEMIRPAPNGRQETQPRGSTLRPDTARESSIRNPSVALLPATTYSETREFMPPSSQSLEELVPPPLITGGGHHRRDSSLESTATVQIGLRLSNMNDMQAVSSPKMTGASGFLDAPPLHASHAGGRSTMQSEANTTTSQAGNPEVSKNKKLPEIPKAGPNRLGGEPERTRTMSPPAVNTVTQPQKIKLVSPKGVGFRTTPGSASSSRPGGNPNAGMAGWI